jgi:hypothetical protein
MKADDIKLLDEVIQALKRYDEKLERGLENEVKS